MRTKSANSETTIKKWFIVDANDVPVGRLATKVASVLRGKHKPTFTPHADMGDFVIVINAEKSRFSGNKETEKKYHRYSGFPGGLRTETAADLRVKYPERIIALAVRGMLPKRSLGRLQLTHLKVYAGATHPHQAQQPQPLFLDK